MNTNEASLEAPQNGPLWVVQTLGATLFLISGLAKLSGDDQMIQTFAAVGVRQWFRYVTGLIEFASAHIAEHESRSRWPRHCGLTLYEHSWVDNRPLSCETMHGRCGRRQINRRVVSFRPHATTLTTISSPIGRAPAVWVTEEVTPIPKNIYGVTKVAAEDLCELFHRDHGLACLVLRTSRFFPEEDDCAAIRHAYEDGNVKANEYFYRRVDLEDVVSAHLLALERAPSIGFGRYIISATTPFLRDDLFDLHVNAALVVRRRVPEYEVEYARRGWKMFARIDRVYVNERARRGLGWQPRYDFDYVLRRLQSNEEFRSPLSVTVGSKGYHSKKFADSPYPVE